MGLVRPVLRGGGETTKWDQQQRVDAAPPQWHSESTAACSAKSPDRPQHVHPCECTRRDTETSAPSNPQHAYLPAPLLLYIYNKILIQSSHGLLKNESEYISALTLHLPISMYTFYIRAKGGSGCLKALRRAFHLSHC